MNIQLYRSLQADQRLSMQIYADQLLAMRSNGAALKVRDFQPSSALERFGDSKLVMRYLRYIDYPRQVAKNINCREFDIHHVVDHGYAHLGPKLPVGKSIVTVHDLIPLLRWKGAFNHDISADQPVNKPVLNLHSLSYLKYFEKVVCVSQSTAKDLVEHLGVSTEKISVIPPIIGDHFEPLLQSSISRFANQYQLDGNAKWVMISGQEFYKNHAASLAAIKRLNQHSEHPVYILKTGVQSQDFNDLVNNFGLQDYVRQIFLEDSAQLTEVYNFVDCLLFPSIYEGFGMPVLESLACGTPVVTSNRGALIELGAGIVDHIVPTDIEALANALHAALFDDSKQQFISNKAISYLQSYRHSTVDSMWSDLYQQVNQSLAR